MNLLLNEKGHAAKIYAKKPGQAEVDADLGSLQAPPLDRATPFPGYYIGTPHRDFFKFGAAYLWAGYYKQALPYLEAVLEQTPDNSRVLLLAAQVCDELEREPEAEAFYRRAAAAEPNSPEANNGLGRALGKRGQVTDARKYLQRAIELKRNYADAINNLGVLYTQQGQLNDAIAAFQYGIKMAPDDDILYLNLGRAYVQSGNLNKARDLMQELLGKKPDNEMAKRALREMAGRN